jgi:hypothetical protein
MDRFQIRMDSASVKKKVDGCENKISTLIEIKLILNYVKNALHYMWIILIQKLFFGYSKKMSSIFLGFQPGGIKLEIRRLLKTHEK